MYIYIFEITQYRNVGTGRYAVQYIGKHSEILTKYYQTHSTCVKNSMSCFAFLRGISGAWVYQIAYNHNLYE